MAAELNLERWKQFLREANSDIPWRDSRDHVDAKRTGILPELLDLLNRFLESAITLEEFRGEFDQKTRTDWTVFGLKGLSGAMYLNMLTKYSPDTGEMTIQLQNVLPAPDVEQQARKRLGEFVKYLNNLIDQGQARRRKLQPARAPYLISAWWHLQQSEVWPIFYQSGRKVLELEDAYDPTGNPVADYFSFRQVFQNLARDLELTTWQCEHLLGWREKQVAPVPSDDDTEEAISLDETDDTLTEELDESTDPTQPSHAQIQWLLAKIGQKVGCQIWIASNDRSKQWNGQALAELSVPALPNLGLDENSQKLISLIDVVWLRGKQVVAAFEVEHTTSIFSGLLRLSDLVVECPNLNFPLYIVTPESRLDKVRKQLSRPTFQSLELHQRCGFFSDEALLSNADAMLQWASSPSSIEQLASQVSDIPFSAN